jgi:uncharacterized membrane protein (DUF373 family)
MSRHREGARSIYQVLHSIVRAFAVFLVLIVGVVAWRKLWVEGRSIAQLDYGEFVSLSLFVVIILGLWGLAYLIGREMRKY